MTKHQAPRRSYFAPLLAASLAVALLSGCAMTQVQDEATILAPVSSAELNRAKALETQGKSADAAKVYLDLATKAQPPAQAQLQIKAAQAYLAAGQTSQAGRTMDAIAQPSLTAGQREILLLTQADLALITDRPKDAITALERMQTRGLPKDLKAKRLGTLASAQRLSNDPVAAARTLDELDGLLEDNNARLVNQLSLVSTLSGISQTQLQTLSHQGSGRMKGWAEISLIARQHGADPKQLDTQYQQWKQRHGGHPALATLGRAYADTLTGGYQASDKVVVVLPRSGRFAAAAKVIQDGIEAASRADSGGQRPALDFSSSSSATTRKGVDYVIGPLEKSSVDALLSKRSLAVPTLALNEATRSTQVTNLFQFSLSPENEAAEVASKAAAMGAKRALVLYPKDAWGERLASAFRRQWSNLGGTVTGQASFDPSWSSYDKTLGSLLKGKDADMLFLVATAKMARKIYPQILAATDKPLPVISTSHVYTGNPGEAADQALVGLYFVDIPWMLDNTNSGPLSRRGSSAASGPLARLYAMGIDAYRVTPRLTSLAKSPGAYYPGQTGGLSIDSLGRVTRQLELGRFTKGGPQAADSLDGGLSEKRP
ncbi:penicillin-binding protein activator [Thiocystis violacea]|uniref:penicillin-binding protein activator n=1 Tax=Thiocystis violacea TaxID=13725 RepID=UPI0019057AA4|nr:penicillin-binding protein activator [Thiocystis violacea]MBK1721732.1 penicillin-binding protein activator [Thiocystis violacea]